MGQGIGSGTNVPLIQIEMLQIRILNEISEA